MSPAGATRPGRPVPPIRPFRAARRARPARLAPLVAAALALAATTAPLPAAADASARTAETARPPGVTGTSGPRAGAPATPSSAADTAPDPSPGFDVLAYRLRLSLRDGSDTIRARQRIELMATRDGLGAVRLHLAGLTVDSARVAPAPGGLPGAGAAAAFGGADGGGSAPTDRGEASGGGPVPRRVEVRRSGDRLTLGVPEGDAVETGDTLLAEVFYRGSPSDGLILRRNLHGDWTAFADNWPDRARHWFASVDHPADKARVAYRLEVPASWSTVANGRRLLERPLPGGRRAVVWAMDRAIPVYTMVVGAGPLAERRLGSVERPGHDASLLAVTFAEDVEAGRRIFEGAVATTRHFAGLLGPLPYPRLALVQAATRFGGMENAGAVYFPEEAVADGSLGHRIVAHEIAHMWFGDDVTEARWGHLWLSEGFATWLAAVDAGRRGGEEAYRREMARLEEAYLGSEVGDRPVVAAPDVPPMELLNENSYEKGAWVLHMLRRTVGDSAHWDGLRRYLDRHRAGTALTSDLRRAVEDASGRELGWFFDQWLRRPGHPDVLLRWRWDPAPSAADGGPSGVEATGGAGRLVLRIRQRQAGPPYRLTFPVEVHAGGRTIRREVRTRDREATVRLPLPAAPDRVTADPSNRVLGPVRARRAGSQRADGGT